MRNSSVNVKERVPVNWMLRQFKIIIVVAVVIVYGIIPAHATDINARYDIVAFNPLPDEIVYQEASVQTKLSELIFPHTLWVQLTNGNDIASSIGEVKWESTPKWETVQVGSLSIIPAGEYRFTPKFSTMYQIPEEIELPVISVIVQPFGVQSTITKAEAPFTYTGDWDITEYGSGKWYAQLLSDGIFTPKKNLTIDIFMVGGGAGGGYKASGGKSAMSGGGSGYRTTVNAVSYLSGNAVSVIIGLGGSGGSSGKTGQATKFGMYTANGGGLSNSDYRTGGSNGGLAGAKGANGAKAFGGDVAPFDNMFFGGGGGGGYWGYNSQGGNGAGGTGGGGYGGMGVGGSGGKTNTGSGGGGAGGYTWDEAQNGGKGGSGVVIIRGTYIPEDPPTTPATITVPSSVPHTNSYTVSWSQSTSTKGVVAGYILEEQRDNGSWTQVYSGPNRSVSRTITRDTVSTINYRVRAYSETGLSSDYKYSDSRIVLNNTVPVVSTFTTQPSVDVKYYETPVLSYGWGAFTDADGDTRTYEVSISKDGSTWSIAQTGTTRTYTYNINSPTDMQFRVRVRATDGRGYSSYLYSNTSNIAHDNTSPVVNIQQNPDTTGANWYRGDCILSVIMSDDGSGLDKITAPAGCTPNGVTNLEALKNKVVTYIVDKPGVYSFTVIDMAGNSSTQSTTVIKLDNINPTISAA